MHIVGIKIEAITSAMYVANSYIISYMYALNHGAFLHCNSYNAIDINYNYIRQFAF